jgi:hypothetical protein
MVLALCGEVCRFSQLVGLVVPDMPVNTSQADHDSPAFADLAHTGCPTSVVAFNSGVLVILGASGFAEVHQPVVRPVPIAVVDVVRREIAMDVEPSKPVMEVIFTVDHGGYIPDLD